MHNLNELAVHQYLDNVSTGKKTMSDTTIDNICSDIKDALTKQFKRDKDYSFSMRMSNIGRPSCQLWFEKNKADKAIPKPTTFIMNMMIGDIIEAIFKGFLKESNVKFKNTDRVKLKINDDMNISGSYDLIIDNSVDDIKSASDWSYKHKFESFTSLKEKDAFGYVAQLAGYAKASNSDVGGWWVINKATGEFKYIPADIDIEEEYKKIKDNVKTVENNEFKRCFEAQDEMFYGKPTGNKILGINCSFCAFRYECWDNLKELPSLVSQAKSPKTVSYVHIGEEYKHGK